jgi:polyphosphate kinase
VHIGTGNYHSATARLYTDFGLFTVDEQIGADVADMFNYLTGYGRPLHYRQVLTAPNQLRDGIIGEIERTIAAHSPETPARITMKMNSLVDGRCIRALYAASQAGVKVELNAVSAVCARACRGSLRTSASSRSSGACSSTRASTPSNGRAGTPSTSPPPI